MASPRGISGGRRNVIHGKLVAEGHGKLVAPATENGGFRHGKLVAQTYI
jgi:hypothetical protein